MEFPLFVAGVFAMSVFLIIDHLDAVLDAFLPHEDPLEQFDPADDSTDKLEDA